MRKHFAAVFSTGLFMLIAGCASTDKVPLPYQGESAAYIYAKGHAQIQDEDYYDAIKTFRSLNAQYPFDKYTELGNLDLIYAYYQDNNSAMALALAHQFLRTYPGSKHVGYVYYIMGVMNFDNGRGFLQRRLPYDMAQHDPAEYIEAYEQLNKSVLINPKGSYVQDATRRMIYINNVVGEYQYNIARFYFDREAYVAAINRAQIVVKNYPQSDAVENALVLLVRSYDILALPVESEKYLEILRANYPDNPYLKSLENAAKKQTVIFK